MMQYSISPEKKEVRRVLFGKMQMLGKKVRDLHG